MLVVWAEVSSLGFGGIVGGIKGAAPSPRGCGILEECGWCWRKALKPWPGETEGLFLSFTESVLVLGVTGREGSKYLYFLKPRVLKLCCFPSSCACL